MMMIGNRQALREYRARASRRGVVEFQPRPKNTGENLIVRGKPVVVFEDRPRRSMPARLARRSAEITELSGITEAGMSLGANTLVSMASQQPQVSTGGWSWLTGLIQTGAQAWGAAKIEQMRQKSLVETYGGNRTLQAMTALDYQRALEARQRGLELDRSLGITSPMMTGATPWILGGVALLGVFLLARKK